MRPLARWALAATLGGFSLPKAVDGHNCLLRTFALDTLCPGKVEQTTCFLDYNYCERDTFYQAALMEELAQNFAASRHAIIGRFDSVHTVNYTDTIVADPDTILIPKQRETAWIRVEHDFKGNFPETLLVLEDYWTLPYTNDKITYSTLVDTPFVAFFDGTQTPKDMGVFPTFDCLFEPTAYMLFDGEIHSRGYIKRKPGVSVPLKDFIDRVGLADAVWKNYPRRPNHLTLFNRLSRDTLPGPAGSRRIQAGFFDLGGRKLRRQDEVGTRGLDVSGLSSGAYLLRLNGRDWQATTRLITGPSVHAAPMRMGKGCPE